MSDDFTPPKQLESDRGGSGRSRRTAIGTGGTGGESGLESIIIGNRVLFVRLGRKFSF